MICVFRAEDDLVGGNAPVDAQGGVVPGDGSFGRRLVEAVALVEEDGLFGQHREAVGKALGNEELQLVLAAEFCRNVFAEGGAADADVHRNVQHAAFQHAYQLALAVGALLVMQPADYAVAAVAFVVLNEAYAGYGLLELTLVEALEEASSGIFENARLQNKHAGYFGLYNIHLQKFFKAVLQRIVPVGDAYAEGLFYKALVKHRIMRPAGLGGVFVGTAGLHVAVVAGEVVHR